MLSWLDLGRLVLNSRRCNELMLVLTCVPTRSPCILRTFRLCSLPVSVWSTRNPVLPFPYGVVAPNISVSSCMCSSKLTRFPTPSCPVHPPSVLAEFLYFLASACMVPLLPTLLLWYLGAHTVCLLFSLNSSHAPVLMQVHIHVIDQNCT